MDLKTFKASTMGEALTQVKSAMGADAIILHTRTFQIRQWWGLRRREMVEITAGKGVNIGARNIRRPPTADAKAFLAANAGVYSKPGAAPRNPIEGGKQIMETAGAQSAALLSISQEMNSLKSMVKDLVTQTRTRQCPQVPEDLFDYYTQLIGNEVAEELAAELIKSLKTQIRPEHLQQPDFIRERLAEQLEKLLPTAGPIVRGKKTGPHVVALIGPTGVGKTTTIAKLAANLKLRDKHRVGLITLDTYRIAAVDQLKRYADIIGAPLRVVNGVDDLREAMYAMRDVDFLLIDTAGRSPNDMLKLNELKSLLTTAEPDEVHLVLSSTSSPECLQLAINRFSDVRVDKIIFTKIDEAAHVGVVLNVLRKVNKSLSYITTGQDVPDDIEVGKSRRLAQLILGAAVKGPQSAA
ncbi:MAG TPA: flagellar biosynthesis protein FlhF [Tepidisphaeraceae bacterium]|jgi:flagellar biosynthesis protein FlhF|nr:flagellar biosynthesis protein FlhF [Tepidisphaeraceae bacterium]